MATSSSVKKASSTRKQTQIREVGPGLKQDSRSLAYNKMKCNVSSSIANSHMQRKSQGETDSTEQMLADSN